MSTRRLWMSSISNIIVLYLCIGNVISISSNSTVDDDIAMILNAGKIDNPGLYLRLMPTGLAYLREIGVKVINNEIVMIALPAITEKTESGAVSIFNARIEKYWPPEHYSLDLNAPSSFTWALSKMHIR